MSDIHLGDVRYFLDHEQCILYAERRDDITKRGIYAEWKAMQELDGFDPSYDTIVDYSLVPSVELNAEEIRELNRDMPVLDPRTGNIAIVTGLEFGRYLLARFFCKIANLALKRKHQVFNSKVEAEVWLLSLR